MHIIPTMHNNKDVFKIQFKRNKKILLSLQPLISLYYSCAYHLINLLLIC